MTSGDANLYGVHPHYTVIEENGNTHGVLFLNSNAQESYNAINIHADKKIINSHLHCCFL